MGSKERPIDQSRTKFINTEMNESHETTVQELSYPWLSDSNPPFIAEILCSYRTYKIPAISFLVLWQARMNEGFLLHKIKRTKSTSKKINRVEITLSLSLALHVKILYTLKFTLSIGVPIDYSFPRTIRIDINVLAHHSFASKD